MKKPLLLELGLDFTSSFGYSEEESSTRNGKEVNKKRILGTTRHQVGQIQLTIVLVVLALLLLRVGAFALAKIL